MRKICTLILSGIIILNEINYVQAEEKLVENKIEVKKVSEDEYLNNISALDKLNFSQVYEKFNQKETFVLYLGRKSCPHCREFSPVLKEFNILLKGKLNYYDIESPDLDENAKNFFEGLQIPAIPVVMYVKEGKILDGWIGGGIDARSLYERFFKKIVVEENKKTVEKKVINEEFEKEFFIGYKVEQSEKNRSKILPKTSSYR